MGELLEQAARCPVCDKAPRATEEMGYSKVLVFLRCPLGHPYSCCGETLIQAINNWNHYIEQRIRHDSARMMAQVAKNPNKSHCRHCQKPTKSIPHFDKVASHQAYLGHSITLYECAECHLTKSHQEAA